MRRALGRPAAAALLAAAFLPGGFFAPSLALAQAPSEAASDPLAAARALFADALRDEDAGRFADALDKFQRVRAVRDTPSVEYRIGSACEGLGRAAEAYGAYRAAQELASGNAQDWDVLRAASERAEILAAHIGRLRLLLPDDSAAVQVAIDGAPVDPSALHEPVPLAPGRHVVRVESPGAAPFTGEVALTGGSEVSLTVPAAPRVTPQDPVPVAKPGPPLRTAGWVAIGGGAALVAASTVLLVLRHDAIADLERACPGGVCPAGAPVGALESTRSRALAEGPAALACGIAGVAALGFGVLGVLDVFPFGARGGGGVAVGGVLR